MRWEIPQVIRDKFTPQMSEAVVVVEAARILYGITFSMAEDKFPEIRLPARRGLYKCPGCGWEFSSHVDRLECLLCGQEARRIGEVPFNRQLDITTWEAHLGHKLAEALRQDFDDEMAAFKKEGP